VVTAQSLCRDCGEQGFAAAICPACHSRRVLRHAELFALTIAHIDCDAFYASVEKRDAPELAAKPVIVGGGRRGVVAACCYIARTRGVRSAMPMFKALAACPDAVVLRPNMAKYAAEGARIRAMMQGLTPLVEPMSIDEAVLDLSGTEALHRAPPAAVLAEFARRVEREAGVTISVGLAANRLLAKIAAGRDKPRGFAVIGRAEAAGLPLPAIHHDLTTSDPVKKRARWTIDRDLLLQLSRHAATAEARAQLSERAALDVERRGAARQQARREPLPQHALQEIALAQQRCEGERGRKGGARGERGINVSG
jgi:hypothetical protein